MKKTVLICKIVILLVLLSSFSSLAQWRRDDDRTPTPNLPPQAFQNQAPYGSVIPDGFTMCYDPLTGKAQLKAAPVVVCSQCHNPRVPSTTSNVHTRHVNAPRSIPCSKCHAGGVDEAWVAPPPAVPNPNAPPACVWTFSSWSECKNGVRERRVLSTSPVPCTGHAETKEYCGTPNVVPCPRPVCTFVYSAWNTCRRGMQTRSVVSFSPAGCVGVPALSQVCAPLTPVPTIAATPLPTVVPTQVPTVVPTVVPTSVPTVVATSTPTRVPTQGTTTTPTRVSSPVPTTVATSTPTRIPTIVPTAVATSTPTRAATPTFTFTPTPTTLDGNALYTAYCSGCHGNGMKGKSASSITSAIASNRGGMGKLATLTPEEITAISLAR